jgi:hypothetical protein
VVGLDAPGVPRTGAWVPWCEWECVDDVDEGKSVVVGVRSEVVVSRGDGLEVPPVCNDEDEEGRPSNGLAEWKVAARGVNWSEGPGPPALVPPPAAALVGCEVDPPVLDEEPGKGELDELGVVGQNCYKVWPGAERRR